MESDREQRKRDRSDLRTELDTLAHEVTGFIHSLCPSKLPLVFLRLLHVNVSVWECNLSIEMSRIGAFIPYQQMGHRPFSPVFRPQGPSFLRSWTFQTRSQTMSLSVVFFTVLPKIISKIGHVKVKRP